MGRKTILFPPLQASDQLLYLKTQLRQFQSAPRGGIAAYPIAIANIGDRPVKSFDSLHIQRSLGEKGFYRTHRLTYRKKDLEKRFVRDFILNIREAFENP